MNITNFIIKNQITGANWSYYKDGTNVLLSDHDALIRLMALAVSNGEYGKGEEREEALGVYAKEVQDKINWAYGKAEEVLEGKYGNGKEREKALGDDYDLIQYWVNVLRPAIYGPSNAKYISEDGGKRYLLKDIPTAKGKMTIKSYNQHKQGSNPYVFDGSGCGFMSFYSAISTIKGLNDMPVTFADRYLKKTTGATKCPISIWAGCKLLNAVGITYTWVRGPLTTAGCKKDIQAHLENGMPVVVSLSYANRQGKVTKAYTNYAHYAILWFATSAGKWYLFDSGGRLPRYVDPDDICQYIPATKARPDYDPVWNGWSNAGGYVKINM